MELFGLGFVQGISMEGFHITTPVVKVGNSLEFRFKLLNNNDTKVRIRLEYGIYYRKANGTLTRKVHKISEKEYAARSGTPITRKHSFKVVTTRRLHPGLHQVAVIVNGNEFERYNFELAEG